MEPAIVSIVSWISKAYQLSNSSYQLQGQITAFPESEKKKHTQQQKQVIKVIKEEVAYSHNSHSCNGFRNTLETSLDAEGSVLNKKKILVGSHGTFFLKKQILCLVCYIILLS